MPRSRSDDSISSEWVDTTLDLRLDSGGKDPDVASPTLRRYHQLLWSKPLPSGVTFSLDRRLDSYLHHASELGEFWFASDSIIQTFLYWRRFEPIARALTHAERSSFDKLGSTIGGTTIFPSQRVDRRPTINGARGLNPKIADRIDLTLECIRRHYLGAGSPLSEALQRYGDFFDLFESFQGYVDFFLFNDLVEEGDGELRLRFFLPFDDFGSPPVPTDVTSYRAFRRASMNFVMARNRRIRESSPQPGEAVGGAAGRTSGPTRRPVMGRLRTRRP